MSTFRGAWGAKNGIAGILGCGEPDENAMRRVTIRLNRACGWSIAFAESPPGRMRMACGSVGQRFFCARLFFLQVRRGGWLLFLLGNVRGLAGKSAAEEASKKSDSGRKAMK